MSCNLKKDAIELKNLAFEILINSGVSTENAKIISDHLVEANLRGLDSHGILRIPSLVKAIEKGAISTHTELEVLRETSAVALVDGGHGLGIIMSLKAMNLAIQKARALGVGIVSVRHSSHIGFLGYYSEFAAKQGMIGIVLTNTEAGMAPTGGIEPVLGTNPISIGIPSRGEPIIIDMATTIVARGKIVDSLQKGLKIKKGWAIDNEGNDTEDPAKALEGALLPFGGPKGYCLAFAFDILTGALAGMDVGRDVKGTRPVNLEQETTKGDLFIAINPTSFIDFEEFIRKVERLKEQVKNCKKAPGVENIYLPGEPEMKNRNKSIEEGILVPEKLWNELKGLRNLNLKS